jgi:nicotinamide-nucleotide amidase
VFPAVNCELLMIGSELLLGQVVDTNASYLAQKLADIGMNLFHKATVGDNLQRIVAALNLAIERSDAVITSGGLGPTEDDITREAVAKVLDAELEFRQELLDDVEAKFARRGLKMTVNNRRQAYLPEGATVLPNRLGTAPAFAVESGSCTVISLPGVPAELKRITETEVLPYLLNRFIPGGAVIMSRELKLSAIAEAAVDEKVGDLVRTSRNPTVGILAQSGVIVIRITAKAKDRTAASGMIDDVESRVRERIGDFVFGRDDETLEGVVARLLKSRDTTLCVVETGTGGAIAQRLVAAGTSQVLGFEVLPQERNVKMFLAVSDEAYEELVADPSLLARELAAAARRKYAADMALVLLEGTQFGLSRSWILLDVSGREQLHDVGLKGCDRWVQHGLGSAALQMTRKALIELTSSNETSRAGDQEVR